MNQKARDLSDKIILRISRCTREVYAVMLDCGIAEEAAQAFLLRLQNGDVPHLKILY